MILSFHIQLIVLIVLLSLTSFSVKPIEAQETPSIPDWLVTEDVLVEELPPVLAIEGEMTDLGLLRVKVDPDNRELLYQYDDGEIQAISLPSEFDVERSRADVNVASDGRAALICNLPHGFEERVVIGTECAVDFEEQGIWLIRECQFTEREWGGLQPTSWEMVSPDGNYRVYVDDTFSGAVCRARRSIYVQSTTRRRVGACTNSESIDFVRWVDDEHLLMVYYDARDGAPPVEELVLLSAPTAGAISLGDQMEYIPYHLIDNNTRLVRVARRDPSAPYSDPYHCALNVIDLMSGDTTDIDPTYCLHDPQMQIDEQRGELLYLNYQIEGEAYQAIFHPRTVLHRVNLNTWESTPTSIAGTAVYVLDLSREWEQIAVVIDDEPETVIGHMWQASSFVRYINPRWRIYDLNTEQVLYEKPLLETVTDEGFSRLLYYANIGPFGFEWTPTGWRTVFVTDDPNTPPLLITSVDGQVSEVELPEVPKSERYDVKWSPDGELVVITLDDGSTYVVDLVDYSTRQVISATEQSLLVNWYEDDGRILVETNNFRQLMVNRWILDPRAD